MGLFGYSRSEVEAMIHAAQPKPSPSYNWGNLINVLLIPAITVIVIFIGQWAVNKEHTAKNAEEIKAEKIERDAMRKNFFESQGKLAEVLGKIDSRLSIQEKQSEMATKQMDLTNRQLEKLNDLFNAQQGRRK